MFDRLIRPGHYSASDMTFMFIYMKTDAQHQNASLQGGESVGSCKDWQQLILVDFALLIQINHLAE